ncbi:MAG: hypothetical protein QOC58_391 [Mycobacterium sp.]|nr:hypothetical protein [Mycobacterium sp.]
MPCPTQIPTESPLRSTRPTAGAGGPAPRRRCTRDVCVDREPLKRRRRRRRQARPARATSKCCASTQAITAAGRAPPCVRNPISWCRRPWPKVTQRSWSTSPFGPDGREGAGSTAWTAWTAGSPSAANAPLRGSRVREDGDERGAAYRVAAQRHRDNHGAGGKLQAGGLGYLPGDGGCRETAVESWPVAAVPPRRPSPRPSHPMDRPTIQ